MIWHVGLAVGLVGFGVCASCSVHARRMDGRHEQAVRACAFLLMALVCWVAEVVTQ